MLHLVCHSAGSIFHAPLLQLLTTDKSALATSGPLEGKTGLGLNVANCTLWAPACTIDLFKAAYVPSIKAGRIGRFSLFTLTDQAERDDTCAGIYHKSLLYLVSNAFEARERIPLFRDGWPILGMERFVRDDREVMAALRRKGSQWILAPNSQPVGSPNASRSTSHGGFDDDRATLRSTLARVTGTVPTSDLLIQKSERLLRGRRLGVDLQTGMLATGPGVAPDGARRSVVQGMVVTQG